MQRARVEFRLQSHGPIQESGIRARYPVFVHSESRFRSERHTLHDRSQRRKLAKFLLNGRNRVDTVYSGNLPRNPEQEFHLGGQANLSLIVSQDVGRSLEKLGANQPHVPVNKDVLPGYEDVVENDQSVGFIKTSRERVVKNAWLSCRIGWTAVELQATTVHGSNERQGVVLVAWLKGDDTTHEEVVGNRGRRAKHLGSANDDASVLLTPNADLQKRFFLILRGFAPVHLGRNDHIGNIELLVQQLAVEARDVMAEGFTAPGEYLRGAGKSGAKPSHVIRTSPEKTIGLPRPAGDGFASLPKVVPASWDHEGLVGRRPGFGRGEDHVVGGIESDVIKTGNRFGNAAKGGMTRYLVNPLSVHINDAPVAQRIEEMLPASHVLFPSCALTNKTQRHEETPRKSLPTDPQSKPELSLVDSFPRQVERARDLGVTTQIPNRPVREEGHTGDIGPWICEVRRVGEVEGFGPELQTAP